MKQLLAILSIILVLFSSCSFEEEYSFKSDWSGKYEAVLDMSGLAEMGDSESKKEELIPEDQIKEMEAKLNSIKGISNADVTSDDENFKIKFGFNFEGLNALNAVNSMDAEESDDSPFGALGKWEMRSKGKKKFYMTMIGLDKMQSGSEGEDTDKAGEMLQVTTKLTFPSKVKQLKSDVAKAGDQENQVIIEYSGKDMMTAGKNWDVEVKL